MHLIVRRQSGECKRVEEALRQSERYLAEAQRLAHTGSWTANHLTGITTHYSDETFRLFGLDPRRGYVPQLEEILQLIHPEDRKRTIEEYEQIVRDKAEYAQDYRIVLRDGSVRHLQSIGHPVLGPGGELLEYFGTVMDVTERVARANPDHTHLVRGLYGQGGDAENSAGGL
jgi:PAS domain S-box-containing protein